MNARKDLVAGAPGAVKTPPGLPGTMLVLREVSVGSVQTIQLLRYRGPEVREAKTWVLPSYGLTAAVAEEVQTVVLDQLGRALVSVCGIREELFTALGWPSANPNG